LRVPEILAMSLVKRIDHIDHTSARLIAGRCGAL